ncbi:MAG: cytochrome b [Lysobacterales bacterium]
MTLKNPEQHWGAVSQSLHWLIVLLLLAQGTVGLLMGDMARGPDKIAVYALHKSVGITLLALAVARLLWRLYAGRPAPVPGTPSWQERAASAMHAALYLLLFAVPISGWVMNSAAGFPLQWFGLFNLPSIAPHDRDLHELAESMHEWLFWALVALAAAHAAAALYHHLFQRDATLARMLPRGWLRAPAQENRDVA